jgi:hypothetical protein
MINFTRLIACFYNSHIHYLHINLVLYVYYDYIKCTTVVKHKYNKCMNLCFYAFSLINFNLRQNLLLS